jgi:hypothetical protein
MPYLLLIYAPYILLCLLLLWVSCALSEPAKSTNTNFPKSSAPLFTTIWQIACERDEVSLATVTWVVLVELPIFMIPNNSLASPAGFYVNP